MLVSNFELLISRIAPVPSAGPNPPFNRKVVQGYFLSITNLDETRDLKLNVVIVSSKATGADINRDFIPITNASVIYDNAPTVQNNVSLPLVATNPVNAFVNTFRTENMPAIKPLQTVLVAILPNAMLAGNPITSLEIRGHVRLHQVPNANGSMPANIKVMLSAECRGTFLDENAQTPTSSFDFDQIAYSLEIASGAALNNLTD